MRYTNKTEYGLLCLISMARCKKKRVSITELAQKEGFPIAFLEKILQALRGAKLVRARQGQGGGYELAKDPSEITLREVIEAIEGTTFHAFCEPEVRDGVGCNRFGLCVLKPIWRQAKTVLDQYFESMTLEELALGKIKI